MKKELFWKIIIPTSISIFSIYISIQFRLLPFEIILVALQTFIMVIILELVYDNYSIKKEYAIAKEVNLNLIQSTELYKKNYISLTNQNSLFRKYLQAQYDNYNEFLNEAINGVVKLRSKHNLLMYYGDFFKSINKNATVSATAITVPKREWFDPILIANEKFIKERHGKVTRIFIISPDDFIDTEKQSRIIEFMERQKSINVEVKYTSTKTIDDSLYKDLIIVDNPFMANYAYPSPTGEYFEADLITNEHRIQELKRIYDNLSRLYAIDFKSKTELINYFNI